MTILLYGLEAYALNKSDIRSLDFVIKNIMYQSLFTNKLVDDAHTNIHEQKNTHEVKIQ